MTFGSETDEAGSHAQLDRFVEAGGNLIDTADVYSAAPPRRSSAAGSPSSAGDRDQVVLATKGRFPMGDGPNDVGLVAPPPAPRARRLAAAARRRAHRPLPGARLRPAHPARGDAAASSTTPSAAGKIPYVGLSNYTGWQLQKVVDLSRLPRLVAAGDPAAAVQPAGPRDRVGDRAGRAGDRARPAAVVAARRWLADRQVHARRAADRRDPARREPGPRRRGLRPPRAAASAPGTSSTRSRRSPRPAASRWRRSRWPGWSTGRR